MMKKSILLALLFGLYSCKKETLELKKNSQEKTEQSTNKAALAFNFNDFPIQKRSIGEIRIGMTIAEADKVLSKLNKKDAEAYDFGFDGGGKSYIYYLDGNPILALIPKMDSDKILAIVAISENLKLGNGLHPKSSVAAISEKYPNSKVYLNMMMSWETMHDDNNDFQFVFMTAPSEQIGAYKASEEEAVPERLKAKSDWITINK